jgi:hypothetical protein
MINILTFILLLALPASAPAASALPASALPTRIEPLTSQSTAVQSSAVQSDDPPNVNSDTQCTADKRWCLQLSQDVDLNTASVNVYDGRKPLDENGKAKDVWSYSVGDSPNTPGGFDSASLKLWPQIIREPSSEPAREGEEAGETVSIGILSMFSTMYSGGGAHSERLALYRFEHSPYGKPVQQEMLDVPWNAAVMIRACFSEADMENRNGACHDLYDFDATLKLDSAYPKDSPPRLIYQTKAIATPGNSRRSEDNSSGKKLSDKDILPRTDDECTYTRGVRYNPVTMRYEFDRPGPDCSEYTVP